MPQSNNELADIFARHGAIAEHEKGLAVALLDYLGRDFSQFSYDGGKMITPAHAVTLLLLSKAKREGRSNFGEAPAPSGLSAVFGALADQKMKTDGLSLRDAYVEVSREHPELSKEMLLGD